MQCTFFSGLLNEKITLQKQTIVILEEGVTLGSPCLSGKRDLETILPLVAK